MTVCWRSSRLYIIIIIFVYLWRDRTHAITWTARVTTETRKFDHITPILRELHWLPVRKRIVYKLAVTVYKCLHGLAPPYLAIDCVPVTSLPSRRHLRSAESGCLAVTGTMTNLDSRNFAVAGAKVWNSLPVDLRLLSRSLHIFGHKLKHYLFMSEPWAHLRFFKVALYKFSHYYYYYYFNADLDDSDTVDGNVKCGTKDGNYMCQIFTSNGEHLGLPGPKQDQTGKSLYFSRNA